MSETGSMEDLSTGLKIVDLGVIEYEECLEIQKKMVEDRLAGRVPDSLLIVSHPPVVTIGKSGNLEELTVPHEEVVAQGIKICRSDRGGKSTFHGPGQIIVYPIIRIREKDLQSYVRTLLHVVSSLLVDLGLRPHLKKGAPGVWIDDRKIASIGISVKRWVSYHGIALNVNTDLSGFGIIHPCGVVGGAVTSLQKELGSEQNLPFIRERFLEHFQRAFGYSKQLQPGNKRFPGWLTVKAKDFHPSSRVGRIVRASQLETVCQSAKCPNLGECYRNGTATFMILGRNCTRNCRFCAVDHGIPESCDSDEPARVALAVKQMGLDYVVVTSVTRDDLEDGGAIQFVETILKVRDAVPQAKIEVLVPDFQGNHKAIDTVCRAAPDVFNHNLETVVRLSELVRPQAEYRRSLDVLTRAASHGIVVKSGLMLGMGEGRLEIEQTLCDLRGAGCTSITLGQYLAPSSRHFPVARYLSPDEFTELASLARSLSFSSVVSGPLVRSSYHARQSWITKVCSPDPIGAAL
jgi:lipoic acid synthetase